MRLCLWNVYQSYELVKRIRSSHDNFSVRRDFRPFRICLNIVAGFIYPWQIIMCLPKVFGNWSTMIYQFFDFAVFWKIVYPRCPPRNEGLQSLEVGSIPFEIHSCLWSKMVHYSRWELRLSEALQALLRIEWDFPQQPYYFANLWFLRT
jgi:hypothetical protein